MSPWWLVLLVVLGAGGCVGLVRTRLDWAEVAGDVRTRAQVLARFGEPRHRAQEDGRDVWYYTLSGVTLAGRSPASEGATVLYLLITPVWWRTHPDANVRFIFQGEDVADAAMLTAREDGFFCGVNIAAAHLVLCGRVP
jgi:hypothetical protein